MMCVNKEIHGTSSAGSFLSSCCLSSIRLSTESSLDEKLTSSLDSSELDRNLRNSNSDFSASKLSFLAMIASRFANS